MEPAAAAAGPGKAGHHNADAFHAVAAGGVAPPAETTRWSSLAATAASLVAVGLGGAALLVWWALAFHPANARLWMVPAGLVLLGTPILAWLSLCLSAGPCAAVRDAPVRV
ncbi:Os04g0577375 [Oryza sativa Japonica Group]|jgi:hypothetical protein|uniref:Uncharacterized protein n=3 Tax=Oryza sativa TaxID=4530 RepID=A0A8J8XYC8_ORYSJ|nr:hypothetical protein OsI_17070 [Oryza sativa Indica Group]EEE61544.1 hypothetical protein OsJ_15871 [Oryza sativa Japonica Group]KAB8096591.1 hypothetical protein EE612_025097 [Oryza sativa]KAF2935478.1 hypothetical protein DAI22_04g234200 [Oryza sativa Japonica Group]BAS90618.1 Os04g0577375 [Oryza sativa Japonica Group]